MQPSQTGQRGGRPPGPNLFALLQPYRPLVIALVVLTVAANALNLVVPQLISKAIDAFSAGTLDVSAFAWRFLAIAVAVLAFTYLQSVAQTYASERVAMDLRAKLAARIAQQTYSKIEALTPAKLLTNLTSDVDGVKLFVSQAVATIIASLFLIVGSSVMLLSINWRLGLGVLGVVPVVGGTFFFALRKVRVLFVKGQEAIDSLNRVINESILGSTLVRILHSEEAEGAKFGKANTESKDIGLSILRVMSAMIPAITLAVNLAMVVILFVGGRFVIFGSMTLGEFTAFHNYLALLIFPIILLGFMSNVMAQASASYMRLGAVLHAPPPAAAGASVRPLLGEVAVEDLSLAFGDKQVLRNVSFTAKAGSRTAIIGPTAAGKTQLLNVLIGLLDPTSGTVIYDGEPIGGLDQKALRRQVGIVFQDSILFNLPLLDNIAFSDSIPEESLRRAIKAAELDEFIGALPEGLKTVVSERGTSLSGGQKQRVMLARALALDPRILLLDDFTARVDQTTERAILGNIQRDYPGITLISVTQKIAPVENYDQIILLMEGEVLAAGTHRELMESSPEYVQIYDSQRSTSHYEIQA